MLSLLYKQNAFKQNMYVSPNAEYILCHLTKVLYKVSQPINSVHSFIIYCTRGILAIYTRLLLCLNGLSQLFWQCFNFKQINNIVKILENVRVSLHQLTENPVTKHSDPHSSMNVSCNAIETSWDFFYKLTMNQRQILKQTKTISGLTFGKSSSKSKPMDIVKLLLG